MADYFTQFSIGIEATPDEARAVLRVFNYIEDPENSPEPPTALLALIQNEDPWSVPDILYQDGTLYITDDAGNGEPWFLAQVLALAMPTAAIDIHYANTCSKARLDAFNGGTWHVRSGEVFNTEDLLREIMSILRDARADADVDCSTTAGGYLLGDVMNEAFEKASSVL